MLFSELLFIGAALSAADICTTPSFDPEVDGGKPFCIIEEVQRVETPYFAVTISPRVLVWLYDDGHTLAIESSVHQSQISMSINVKELEPSNVPETLQAIGCPEVKVVPGVKSLCDSTDGEFVYKSYMLLNGATLITIGLSAGPLAKHELSLYEGIIDSVAAVP